MIKSLKLKNFRNFKDIQIDFENEKFFILGENGKGKTNILEALSILNNNSVIDTNFNNLIKSGENTFYIEYINNEGNSFGISFNKEKNKKNYLINKKSTSKKKFSISTNICVVFSPIIMNIIYLGPSLRRSFIDQILISSFSDYANILSNYKKILKNRNIVLKNIRENKSNKNEITFWDQKLINESIKIYNYRFKLIDFFVIHMNKSKEYFLGKVENIEFFYKTKVQKNSIENDMKEYLEKNIDRDIILGKTHIGPHIDDFNILVDKKEIINYASRGEIKSIIIWLKLLETAFIEKYSDKKPILLIDDLLSELDEIHKKLLINKMNYYQTFITSISLTITPKNCIKLK